MRSLVFVIVAMVAFGTESARGSVEFVIDRGIAQGESGSCEPVPIVLNQTASASCGVSNENGSASTSFAVTPRSSTSDGRTTVTLDATIDTAGTPGFLDTVVNLDGHFVVTNGSADFSMELSDTRTHVVTQIIFGALGSYCGGCLPDQDTLARSGTLTAGTHFVSVRLGASPPGSLSLSLTITFTDVGADETHWINPNGGSFADADNWDPTRVPTADDRIRFDLAGGYTVDLGGPRSVQRAVVHGSLLDLVGGALDLLAAAGGEPPLAIGDGATLTLANATVRAADVVIGDGAGAESVLRVADGGRLEPSNGLRIGDVGPGTLEITGGTITGGDVSVGAPDAAAPIPASLSKGTGGRAAGLPLGRGRITVQASALGNGVLKLEGTQRKVTVGDRGPGSIEVLDGGVVDNAGETIIGASPGPASVTLVTRSDSDLRANWISGGTVTVGKDAVGELSIVAAGSMRAPDMRIGAESGSVGEVGLDDVFEDLGVDGPLLDITDTLDVGDAGRGDLDVAGTSSRVAAKRLRLGVSSGGHGQAGAFRGGTVSVTDLEVGVEGAGDLDIGSDDVTGLLAGGRVFASTVNIAGAFSAPAMAEPSSVEVIGDDALLNTDTLLIGDRDLSTGVARGVGSLRVARGATLSLGAFTAGLVNLLNGELLIEDAGTFLQASLPDFVEPGTIAVIGGQFVIRNGALASAGKVVVSGPLDPTSVFALQQPTLAVEFASLQVTHTLNIGAPDDATRLGQVVLDEGVIEVGDAVTCNPGCIVSGSGLLRINSVDVELEHEVLTHGDFSPGHSPGTIRVEGNFRQGPAGRLVMEAAGLAPGDFDRLEVTGQTTLGGTLDVRFLDGFLPQQGDTVPFLTVGGKTVGTFDTVTVHGVAPGFDFSVGTTDDGTVTLTALNDAEPAACADPTDTDADGQTCADNCPAVANADQADLDGDLAGDACDPCTHGVPVVKPTLTLKKGKLNLKGMVRLATAPTLDPLTTGVRLLLADAMGAPVLDLTAPPGPFDKSTHQGWKQLSFKSRTGPVTAVKLAPAKGAPEVMKVNLKGLLGNLAPGTIAQPMALTLLLDASATPTGTCGEVRFTGPAAVNPLCTLKRGALACKDQKRK